MSKPRGWDVGLPCRYCTPVRRRRDGGYAVPVRPNGKLGEPVAWHGVCKVKFGAKA